jgi:hypothetical protein
MRRSPTPQAIPSATSTAPSPPSCGRPSPMPWAKRWGRRVFGLRWKDDGGKGEMGEENQSSRLLPLAHPLPCHPSTHPPTATQTDWGEAIDVSIFYGRQAELDTLTTWVEGDRCRLVAILGMTSMGKTALSVKLAQHLSTSAFHPHTLTPSHPHTPNTTPASAACDTPG